MLIEIKNRWTDAVIYSCDVPATVPSGMEMRHALEKATQANANLSDAYLSGAKFSEDKLLIGFRPFMAIGPIGSRCAMLSLWLTDKGPMVKAGCFTGTLEEFAEAVKETHGDNEHGKEYEMAILMFESHCALWTPEAA